jgi:hypothetical protein
MADEMQPEMEMEQEAPEQAQGPSSDPVEIITKIGDSLTTLQEALKETGAPKEAMGPLEAAVSSYIQFVDVMTGAAKGGAGGGVQDEQAMGSRGAVPADQYTGKGVKAVRA